MHQYPPANAVSINYIIPTVVHIYFDSYLPNNLPGYDDVVKMISDVNVYLRKANADTSDVAVAFRNLIGNAQIELRLARFDTLGNCISGIYYHQLANAAAYPTPDYQDYQHYFNVHINVAAFVNAAAYATPPDNWNSIPGIGNDGIFFVQSGAFTPTIFVHELGHWLGLLHPWGNTNNPGGCMGDDFVADTPVTAGSPNACDTLLNFCNPGIFENVQNFMDYAPCKIMFTLGQVNRMYGILNDNILNRHEVWINSNLIATGVLSPPACVDSSRILVIAFTDPAFGCSIQRDYHFACNPITAVPDSVHWTFQNGIPATSTNGIQAVTFSSTGMKNISMTSFYGNVPHIENRQVFIAPLDSLLTQNGLFLVRNYPFVENFENGFFFPDGHLKIEAADTTWQLRTGVGYNSDSCLFVRQEHNIGTDTNKVILGTFNLDSLQHPIMTFYVAASKVPNGIGRKLMISGKQWCGNPYNNFFWNDIIYDSTITMTNVGPNFIPSAPGQWKKITVNLSAMKNYFAGKETEVSILLVKDFTIGSVDNNFYLDNISVRDSIVGLPPIADFSMADSVFCLSNCDAIELVDRSANLPDTWVWNISPFNSEPVLPGCFNFAAPDSFQIWLRVSNAFGVDSTSKWIHFPNFNNLAITVSDDTICAGDTVTLSASGFDPDVTFLWENVALPANSTLLSQTNSSVQAIPTQPTTTYRLTATNSEGCIGIRYINVIRNAYAYSSITSSANCIGVGGTVNLSSPVCPSCQNIVWAPGLYLNTTSGTNVTSLPLPTTTVFSVTYTLNGCTSIATDTVFVANPLPAVSLSANDSLLCNGQQVTLYASGSAGLSYAWSGPPCCIIPFATYGDSATSTPPSNTWFTVQGTDIHGCVSAIDSLLIQVPAASTFVLHPFNQTPNGGFIVKMCFLNDSLTMLAQGAPTNTYSWSCNSGTLTGVNGANATFHNLTPGFSQITVVSTNPAGCQSSFVGTIERTYNYNEPIFSVSPSLATICQGDSVSVLITPGNFYYYYYWMNHFSDISGIIPVPVSPINQGNGSSAWLSPITTTQFQLTAYDWYTACAATKTVRVNVNPAPTVQANASATLVCNGQQVTLNGSGATTYSWSNSVVNGVPFIPLATQTYTLTGTDGIGCSASDTITVTVDVCNANGDFSDAGIKIWPTPASDELTISNSQAGPMQIFIRDLTGKIVLSKESTDATTLLNVSGLANGIYLLQIKTPESEFISKVCVIR